MESAITGVMFDIMGVLYIDDTNLFIMNNFTSSELNMHDKSQSALTGGVLKPEKLVDYEWDAEGFWSYVDIKEEHKIFMLLPDGSSTEIEQLPGTFLKKTWGSGRIPPASAQSSSS